MSRLSAEPRHRASGPPAGPVERRAPKHQAPRPEFGLRERLGRARLLSGLALAAATSAVVVGLVGDEQPQPATLAAQIDSAAAAVSPDVVEQIKAERDQNVSRSDRRTGVDRTKVRLLSQEAESGGQVTRTKDLGSGDPRAVAKTMLGDFGFSSAQFSCLDALWTKESGWDVYADNPTSSAYGIPQALPGSKMSSAGADWATNPATQIRWGLGYIATTYGSPCSAWSHSQANNWY